MHTMPATTPRLVLLLKSGPGTGTSIAHKGGYAKYGNPPRWHKITPDAPAPKGAPVAAHPKSAGHHEAAAHFSDEQWAALKLPDSNVNAPVFNKALEKLRTWSDAGDVTAIVGAQYGTNTYGAKLAKIANHLLGLHGSAHTVTPGQKPGTHAAAQVAEPADPHPTGLPEHLAPKEPEPEAATPTGPLTMPDFQEGKTTTGVQALYQGVGQKIIDHGHAGNVSVLEGMPDPAKKMWHGKTPNSKKLLDLHAAALAHAKGEGSGYAAPAAEADPLAVHDTPASKVLHVIPSSDAKAGYEVHIATPKSAPGSKFSVVVKDVDSGEFLPTIKSFSKESDALEHAHALADGKKPGAGPKLPEGWSGSPDGVATKPGPDGGMVDKNAAGLGWFVVAHNEAKADVLHGQFFPTQQAAIDALAAAEAGPKEGDTKQGADGMLVFKNGHWVKVEQAAPAKVKKATLIDISTAIQTITPGQTKFSTNGAGKLATAAAKKGDGPGMAEAYAKAVSFSLPKTAKHIKAVAQAMGVDVSQWDSGATPASAPVPPPAAAPATPSGGLPSMDNWAQTGGQGGSNPGGKFKDPSGQEWYCKWPDDAEAAKSEVLAAKLYALAGLSSQDCMLVSKGGKTAIATKWVDIKKAASASALAKADGAQSGFVVDAWLGNWDVVGLSYDNLQIGPDGKAHRVDAGGSLEYRAQGEKKPFGSKVDELDTLLDAGKNPQAASVFKGMTTADLTASAAKVLAISDVAIRAMVNQYGPGDAAAKAKLADTLIARKADLAKRFPAAVKKKKAPVFKPEDISAPPSFLNWGGKGSSGPSSKEFLNKANEEAVQAIFAAAKTGDLDAIKGLKAKVYDKDTGQVTGEKPVLEHPSQHVKGYAQQAVNEINYQLNPPKKFRFDGGHPLHSLNAAYPAFTGPASSTVAQKLGKFIVLGEPGVVKLSELGLPEKITHAEGGGNLSVNTYAKQAQAAIAKMPATQKQAVKSYTGSSYGAMNGSLWDGNPTGAAKAAGEALKTLGHDIAPGTVLSRQLSLHGENLKAVLGSVGKILQEPAIMSTSIRPSSWVKNVQLKLHVGPGVKGLWVGHHSLPGGGALSSKSGEDEMILPPGTRLLVMSVRSGGKDADGFGAHGQAHVIEAIILPTE
jgi:hypothetical protein